jgi:2-oxoglutarate dehydrogenase complex dehydrogenase (E1) component-like enzyme
MQVTFPTTPAQYFHLLRKQVKQPFRIPLLVMAPKGLLRHPECISTIAELSEKRFEQILADPAASPGVSKLLFCSGRIYYDLAHERKKREDKRIAIVRLEQLYPFPEKRLKEMIDGYQQIKTYIWAQEEPQNMGAYHYVEPYFRKLLPEKRALRYIGRKASAVTATSSHAVHEKEVQQILDQVFEEEFDGD